MALQACRIKILFMCATVHDAVYITLQKHIRGKLMRTLDSYWPVQHNAGAGANGAGTAREVSWRAG